MDPLKQQMADDSDESSLVRVGCTDKKYLENNDGVGGYVQVGVVKSGMAYLMFLWNSQVPTSQVSIFFSTTSVQG